MRYYWVLMLLFLIACKKDNDKLDLNNIYNSWQYKYTIFKGDISIEDNYSAHTITFYPNGSYTDVDTKSSIDIDGSWTFTEPNKITLEYPAGINGRTETIDIEITTLNKSQLVLDFNGDEIYVLPGLGVDNYTVELLKRPVFSYRRIND